MSDSERGFTLIEVLVALVISAVLIVILMDGAASARQAKAKYLVEADAIRLGQSVLIEATHRPTEAVEREGREGPLHWSLSERILQRDPRGFFELTEIRVDVADSDERQVQSFSARKLRPMVRS